MKADAKVVQDRFRLTLLVLCFLFTGVATWLIPYYLQDRSPLAAISALLGLWAISGLVAVVAFQRWSANHVLTRLQQLCLSVLFAVVLITPLIANQSVFRGVVQSSGDSICDRLVSKLNKHVEPAHLQAWAISVLEKYPEGATALNLSATPALDKMRAFTNHLGTPLVYVRGTKTEPKERYVELLFPGGFGSYGVIVTAPAADVNILKKRLEAARGVNQQYRLWREGILVYYGSH